MFILSIGLNDKDTKTQLIKTADAVMLIADTVGDCSIFEGHGIYTHDNGERVIEKTLQVQVFSDYTMQQMQELTRELCLALNQESIVLSIQTLDSCEFITA